MSELKSNEAFQLKLTSTKDVVKFILFDRLGYRLLIMILAFAGTLAALFVPYFQKDFMASMIQTEVGILNLSTCTGLAFISFVFLQATNFLGQNEALKSQRSLSQALYNHILNLKPLTMSRKSVGEMVALYTTDIPSATMWLEQTVPYALTTAFPLILAPLFLKSFYQIPFSLSLVLIVVVVCINVLLAKRQSYFFSQFKTLAGQRMGLVNEWIQNIKSLKSLNWVQGFEKKILKKRIEETYNRVAMVTNGQFMNSISSSITFWLNLAVLFFISLTFNLTVQKVDLIAIMWVLGIFLARPLRQLPWFFTMMFDAWTSIKRLGSYFELKNDNSIIKEYLSENRIETQNTVAYLKNLNLEIDNQTLLKNINLKIFKSEIVALIGPVGAGKSLLIKSLMNETPFHCEQFFISRYGYLPQEPFILSALLQENIVFDYQENLSTRELKNIQRSLSQAQFDLEKDRMLEGLKTLIGERGLNISGGQKQRLNLARLFYDPQPLFLLDDPLSAVDVLTEQKLIEVIKNYKEQGFSFLVVTQRYDFLPSCDRILFMRDGCIEFCGTYKELIQVPEYLNFIQGELKKDDFKAKESTEESTK